MSNPLPKLETLFPFSYEGGGYYRRRGVPKGTHADIVHGDVAIKMLYHAINEHLNQQHATGNTAVPGGDEIYSVDWRAE